MDDTYTVSVHKLFITFTCIFQKLTLTKLHDLLVNIWITNLIKLSAHVTLNLFVYEPWKTFKLTYYCTIFIDIEFIIYISQ